MHVFISIKSGNSKRSVKIVKVKNKQNGECKRVDQSKRMMPAHFRGCSVGRRFTPVTGQETPKEALHFSAPGILSWDFVPSGPAFFHTAFAKMTQRGPNIPI